MIANNAVILVTEVDNLRTASARELLRKGPINERFFDASGRLWESEVRSGSFKPTLLNRILAHTFYNPTLEVSRTWKQAGPYALEELKALMQNCIDRDDDVLTQWVDATSLKARLEKCRQFSDIVTMLSAYVFEPDEEKIWQEFPLDE
ncbi:hypothetical protein MUN81_08350 [Hymenobacter sp. 5317J-9]|uniref:hypothetical protein n=1 Tax=Hymenobacter sp. 5317J-9 TaxID=2932250 RepID=UPI001FD68120|nr:hypothetical protein [Hymenobacter sp. 5317J-9]UOQ99488.1 hypothetical protein MUN81_08350 [Hymenobacter sp. 5317J-9]